MLVRLEWGAPDEHAKRHQASVRNCLLPIPLLFNSRRGGALGMVAISRATAFLRGEEWRRSTLALGRTADE